MLSFTPFEQAMLSLVDSEYPAPDLNTLGPIERAVYGMVDPSGITLTPSEQWIQTMIEPGVTQLTFLTDFGEELLFEVDASFIPPTSSLTGYEQFIKDAEDAGVPAPVLSVDEGDEGDGLSPFSRAILSVVGESSQPVDAGSLSGPERALVHIVSPGSVGELSDADFLFVLMTKPGVTQLPFLSDFEASLLQRVDDRFIPPESSSLSGYEEFLKAAEDAGLPAPVLTLVTSDSPNNHVTPTGSSFDGVARVLVTTTAGTFSLSGVLLQDGIHVATAAHSLTNANGAPIFSSGSVVFHLPSGTQTIGINSVAIHPRWNGNAFKGHDIAILTLSNAVSSEAQRYQLNRTITEVLQVHDRAAYGQSGMGIVDPTNFPSGTKRNAQNRYEALGEALNGPLLSAGTITPGTQLIYDFDNGQTANDAAGTYLGIANVGLGNNESMTATGDSGGGNFISGIFSGITSYAISAPATDVSPGTNFSFGEFGSDMRIRSLAGWIDKVADFQGTDTIGLYVPSTSTFHLRNSNSAGAADISFQFGPTSSGWTPFRAIARSKG